MSAIPAILVIFFVTIVIAAMIWILFFQNTLSLFDLLKKILDIALLPFRLFIRLFTGGDKPPPITAPPPPSTGPSTTTEIVSHQIAECPPCNVTCPDPPVDTKSGPLEMEIGYLKSMLKFVGTISRRENAINAQYKELYPGFSVMSPHVQRISAEYNFLKNQIREDEGEYSYFKNYFTKLTGIPSTSSAVHYDLIM